MHAVGSVGGGGGGGAGGGGGRRSNISRGPIQLRKKILEFWLEKPLEFLLRIFLTMKKFT